MSGVGAKAVCSDLNRLFFLRPFSNLPSWISCQKITPLIFQRSTKFTPTGAGKFLE